MANHVAAYLLPGTPTVEIIVVDDVTLGELQSFGPTPGVGSPLVLVFSTPGEQPLADHILSVLSDFHVKDNSGRALLTFPHDTLVPEIQKLLQQAIAAP